MPGGLLGLTEVYTHYMYYHSSSTVATSFCIDVTKLSVIHLTLDYFQYVPRIPPPLSLSHCQSHPHTYKLHPETQN